MWQCRRLVARVREIWWSIYSKQKAISLLFSPTSSPPTPSLQLPRSFSLPTILSVSPNLSASFSNSCRQAHIAAAVCFAQLNIPIPCSLGETSINDFKNIVQILQAALQILKAMDYPRLVSGQKRQWVSSKYCRFLTLKVVWTLEWHIYIYIYVNWNKRCPVVVCISKYSFKITLSLYVRLII